MVEKFVRLNGLTLLKTFISKIMPTDTKIHILHIIMSDKRLPFLRTNATVQTRTKTKLEITTTVLNTWQQLNFVMKLEVVLARVPTTNGTNTVRVKCAKTYKGNYH
jgi:hypothetical protein